ncbi:MAG: hypothetical protein ACRD9W_11805, partial [Terriglobia bacterium]
MKTACDHHHQIAPARRQLKFALRASWRTQHCVKHPDKSRSEKLSETFHQRVRIFFSDPVA